MRRFVGHWATAEFVRRLCKHKRAYYSRQDREALNEEIIALRLAAEAAAARSN
jgi:hypothetical protein